MFFDTLLYSNVESLGFPPIGCSTKQLVPAGNAMTKRDFREPNHTVSTITLKRARDLLQAEASHVVIPIQEFSQKRRNAN